MSKRFPQIPRRLHLVDDVVPVVPERRPAVRLDRVEPGGDGDHADAEEARGGAGGARRQLAPHPARLRPAADGAAGARQVIQAPEGDLVREIRREVVRVDLGTKERSGQ